MDQLAPLFSIYQGMKLFKPHFALKPIAFQIYCYLWKKLELLPEQAQARRIVVASKGELERELGHSINTIRQALDQELELAFQMVRKLPNEPDKTPNRILLTEEKEWNWTLIRQMYQAQSARERRIKMGSLFDDLSIIDPGSDEKK